MGLIAIQLKGRTVVHATRSAVAFGYSIGVVMPRARELRVMESTFQEMDLAAVELRRIRLRGVVTARGDGYSGRYRNVWLHIRTGEVTTQLTATPFSQLGTAPVGSEVDVVCTLTGLVDLSRSVYFGERAQLLLLRTPEDVASHAS